MIEKLTGSEGCVLGVRVSGKVSLEMENEWINNINEVLKEHGKVDILIFLDKHATWGLKAGIEDLKWCITHVKKINKIALVSDNNFYKWFVALDAPFGKLAGVGEKYFKPDEIEDAWKWLRE